MKSLQTCLLLLSITFISAGFSWGGTTGQCKEALKIADTLESIRDDAKMRQTEAKIIAKCPDGAAAHFVKALKQERASNFDAAIEEYRRTLQLVPAFARASGNLGLLYAQKGMTDEASVELSKGLSANSNPFYHKAIAKIFAEQKIFPLAIYHYNEAGKELTADASIFVGLAEIYSSLSQPDKALAEYQRALLADKGSAKAYIGAATINIQRNEIDKALEQLKRGEAVAPQNRDIHLLLAGIYEKKGDSKLAEHHSGLGGKNNELEAVRKEIAQSSVGSGVGAEIESLKAAIKEHPEDVYLYEKLGQAYRTAGKDAEAIVAYREASHRNSTNSDVHLNLGILYEKKFQIDEAVVAYKRALVVDPSSAEAHLRLGDIRFSRGLYQEAVEQYSEYLKLRPASPDIHLKLARIFVKSKEAGLALSSYNSVLTYSPNDGDANREIGTLYAQKGDTDKAIQHYRKALAYHKDDNDARTSLISVYVKNKQYEEITALLKEAVELSPEDPINHYKLGLIFDFKKEYDNAVVAYKKSIELKPDNARALNALGRLYMKTGRLSEAKEALEAAKKADATMEETAVLLNNIKDEFNPEPRKISKGKKSKSKSKGKKSKKAPKKTKAKKTTKASSAGSKKTAKE